MADQKDVTSVKWGKALAKAMEASRDLKTQTALAKKSGVAQSTIGRILRGEVNTTSKKLERLAKAFGISLVQLADIAQENEVDRRPTKRLNALDPSRRIPLISWIQAGAFAESVDNYQPGDAENWVAHPTRRCGPRTFALRVSGESMEPDYNHGEIIYVDPDVVAEHGKDVVVRLEESNEATFKKLVIEDERRRYLRPLNPNWKDQIINLPPDARIVGVVIGKWVDK